MSAGKDLALVMPVYNEEGCIDQVLRAWNATLKEACGDKLSFVMVVVNDGSRDSSGEVLDRLAKEFPSITVIHQKNGGHGVAVRNGYELAVQIGAEWIFQTDSDDQFYSEDFLKLFNRRDEGDFLLGWRHNRDDPKIRKTISLINKSLVFLLTGAWICDPNTPFRLMKRSFLEGCLHRIPATVFAPNIFLSLLGFTSGAKVIEMPVRHKVRQTGEVSIKRWKLFKVCLRAMREFVQWRLGRARDLYGWYSTK